MRKNNKKKVLTGLVAFSYVFTAASPTALAISESKIVLSQSLADRVKSTIQLPERFTNVAIGNEGAGNSYYNSELKEFHIEGSGGQIGKDPGKTDSYQLVSHEVKGDAVIVARLKDFDMTNAPYGQAGIILRSDDESNNADYLAVYVEPSKNEFRYAYRDNTTGGTGAGTINGLTVDMKNLYIKVVKTGISFKFYISQSENFDSILAEGSQNVTTAHDTWNAGFVVGNGNSNVIATATFDNVEIKDQTGVVYTTKEVLDNEVEEDNGNIGDTAAQVYLPKNFIDNHIGNNESIGGADFNKETKEFVVNGSGTYVGKDTGSTDNYQFVSYEVKGDGYIVARMSDFDMSNAQNGQAGVFVRSDNNSNNAEYFGVYVEPSKKQYRYAYRNPEGKSGAAAITGLNEESKGRYIKIEKEGTSFRYSISEDPTFPVDNTLTNSQTMSSSSETWNFGFVVSNGGSSTSAKATFDNVKIGTAIGTYYDSTLDVRPVDTVENVQAVAGDAEVNLTWDSVKEADRYIIKRSIQADGEYETIATLDSNINSYKDLNLTNFRTYYYKIAAANTEGESYDSAVVRALPNNTNKENIQYEENAAVFTMTEEPNDTVFSKNISIKGSTDKDGTISIKVNGSLVKENEAKNADEVFEQNITLVPGRNTIEIVQVTADGKKSVKTYNLVCLTQGSFDIIVDKNYAGEEGSILQGSATEDSEGIKVYKSITSAVSSISTKNKERKTIFVRNGVYKEKTTVEAPYVSIVGEDSEKTIWTFDAANGTIDPSTGVKYGTSKSASVTIKTKAVGFTAENITFENSFKEEGNENEQAVALNNQADKSIFINCRFIGNQDTLLADASSTSPARQYYYGCYIEGDVDFIFGRAQAVFDNCDIASYNRKSSSNNGYVTAADTWDKDQYGYLIMNSRLIGLDNIGSGTVSLGRPWRPSSQTEKMTPSVVYVNTYMGDHITAKGWDDMTATSLAENSRFFEFASFGPGARLSSTRNVLSVEEAENYTIENVFGKDSAKKSNGENAYAEDWNPTSDASDVNMNNIYKVDGEEFAPIIKVELVTLNESKIDCIVGYTDTLKATINPGNATNKDIAWSSSNESVVTVDQEGNIEAIAGGSAVITVNVDGKTAECTVNVRSNEKPEIIVDDMEIFVGSQFEAEKYATANDSEDGDITSNIAVEKNTVNTAKAGTYVVVYKVTDSDNNTTIKEIKVKVVKPILVSKITLSTKTLKLSYDSQKGDDNSKNEYKLSDLVEAEVSPANAINQELEWCIRGGNKDVLEINQEADKLIVNGSGTAYIDVKSKDGSNKKVSLKVTVDKKINSIKIESNNIENSTLNLCVKDKEKLKATLNPEDISNEKLTWTSSNPRVATVSSKGEVKAISEGTTTIKVTTSNGVSNEITVTVKNPVTSIKISKKSLSLSLSKNQVRELSVRINPTYAETKSITWISKNENIAKVDEHTGKVTPVSKGSTEVIVSVVDKYGNEFNEDCKITVK